MGLQTCGLNLNHVQKELHPHGTPGFPCAAYDGLYSDKPEQSIPWHWHEELEIVYVKRGSLKLRIPSKSFLLTQGDCMAVNSNILHAAEACPKCRLLSLVFHPRLITGTGDSAFATKYLSPLMAHTAFDGFLFQKKEHSLRIMSFLQAFEALSFDAPGFEFTVRECLRCFKRNIQLSPMQYLLKYRIMQGAELLLGEQEKSISEIALLCGFESPSHFSKMFWRFYNCPPKIYQNTCP